MTTVPSPTDTPPAATAYTQDGRFVIPVDMEHNGIRLAGCASLLIAAGVSFFVLSLAMPGNAILVFVLSLAMGAAASFALDHYLRGRWPSGREVVLSQDEIVIKKNDATEYSINPAKRVNVLMWHFEVKRNGRVPKGWYVVGCALEQDEAHLPVYALMPAKRFNDELPLNQHFKLLARPSKIKLESDAQVRLAGEQRRLQAAEQMRGTDGAEMTFEQFATFLTYLQDHHPQWMPQH